MRARVVLEVGKGVLIREVSSFQGSVLFIASCIFCFWVHDLRTVSRKSVESVVVWLQVHERNLDTDLCLLLVRKLLRTNSRQVKVDTHTHTHTQHTHTHTHTAGGAYVGHTREPRVCQVFRSETAESANPHPGPRALR